MPIINMSIDSFSIKALDWERPISLNFANNGHDDKQDGGTFVLAGLNAGGKTVTLKALELFSKLVCEPNDRSFSDFEDFSKAANISEMDIRYSFLWPADTAWLSAGITFNDDPYWEMEIENEMKFCEYLDYPYEAIPEDGIEVMAEVSTVIDTKFRKSTEGNHFLRTEGIRVRGFATHSRGEEDIGGFDELIPGGWEEEIFQTKGKYEIDRLETYEFDLNEEFDKNPLGLYSQMNFEAYRFDDKEKRLTFVPHKAILLKVEDAYNLEQRLMSKLNEFNSNIYATKNGQISSKSKSWINKNLNLAFVEAKNSYSNLLDKTARDNLKEIGQKLSKNQQEIENIDVELDKLEHADEMKLIRYFQEINLEEVKTEDDKQKLVSLIDNLTQIKNLKEELSMRKSEREVLKSELAKVNSQKLFKMIGEFHKKIHPKFDTSSLENISSDKEFLLTSLNDVQPPSIDCVMERYPEPKSPEFDKSGHDGTIGGIFYHIMKYYGHLIREYWPEFASWGLLSAFIEFPDKSAVYYSSGQKRMLKLAHEMINSNPHETILIDEPELSLHIDWQRGFIERMEIFSRNMIIATHSPDIIYHHTEKVVHVPPIIEE